MNDNAPQQSENAWRRWLAPLVIAALMALAYALGLHNYLNLQSLAENRETLRTFTVDHWLSAILLYMLIYATAVALSFPGAVVLTISGGFLFGWLAGGSATVLAATAGATAIFQIVRTSFAEAAARRAGPQLAKLKEGFAADAFHYLLFLRLVPAFPFWLVNIAAALANVKVRTFAAATVLGIIPATFAFSFVGAGLDSIIDKATVAQALCIAEQGKASCPFELSTSSLITWDLLFAFAALSIVALIPVGLRKWKQRNEV